ncbi:MAG: hypothetical protein HC803_08305 [Saprospiraceae bacterium]|nr:hypothetical protein [Saprospiraceae bacterium]
MKNSTITLENVEEFSTSLSKHHLKWMFEDVQGKGISSEVKAQIIPLHPEAAQFLLDFKNTQEHLNNELFKDAKFHKEMDVFISKKKNNETIKAWLLERNIPLDRKVFWVNQLNVAFVMTWEMVIKFSDILFFGSNEILWDKTMNWMLSFQSEEVFSFMDNLMYDPNSRAKETEAIDKLFENIPKSESIKETAEIINEAARVEDTEVMSMASFESRKAKISSRQGLIS